MSLLLQHLVVLVLVGACVAVVGVGAIRTLWGAKSQVGKCCSRGCGAAEADSGKAAQRMVFVPADSLRLRK